MKNVKEKKTIFFENYWLIFLIIFFICFIFIGFYIWRYWGKPFSLNTTDWGAFGDYLTGTIGLGFSLITIIFLYFNYIHLKKESNDNKAYLKAKLFNAFAKKFENEEFFEKLKRLYLIKNFFDYFINYKFTENIDVTSFNFFEASFTNNDVYFDYAIISHLNLNVNNFQYVKDSIMNDKEPDKFLVFLKRFRSEKPKQYKYFDDARRPISNFFQRMSILLECDNLDDKHLTKFWNKTHFDLINNIIIPMEKVLAYKANNVDVSYLEKIANLFKNIKKLKIN